MSTLPKESLVIRQNRRQAVESIMNQLYRIYEIEYSHWEDMMVSDPNSNVCFDALHSSDALLDVIGLLYGVYQ
jgi:hypothetical protein